MRESPRHAALRVCVKSTIPSTYTRATAVAETPGSCALAQDFGVSEAEAPQGGQGGGERALEPAPRGARRILEWKVRNWKSSEGEVEWTELGHVPRTLGTTPRRNNSCAVRVCRHVLPTREALQAKRRARSLTTRCVWPRPRSVALNSPAPGARAHHALCVAAPQFVRLLSRTSRRPLAPPKEVVGCTGTCLWW